MIKYVEDIIKEIDERGAIKIANNCATGDEFEKWILEESIEAKNKEE